MRKIFRFENAMSTEDDLRKFDVEETKKLNSLTLRKNLLSKGSLLKKLFETLGIDESSGEGLFTHIQAQQYIDWLYENTNRQLVWNQFSLGPFLGKKGPKDPTKFVQEALGQMGLKTEKKVKTKKRLSHHQISKNSWGYMNRIITTRRDQDKSIAKVSEAVGEIEEIAPITEPDLESIPTGDEQAAAWEPEFDLEDTWCQCGDIVSERFAKQGLAMCELCYQEYHQPIDD